ncbi:MAG TPA: hypothetical protein VGI90_16300 [Steroidobacteraceae bacterium]|jgi:hypothetical protein
MRAPVLIAAAVYIAFTFGSCSVSAATPDVAGFRTGIPAQEAYEALKKYAGARPIKNAYMNLPDLSAKPVIHELDMSDGDVDNSAEAIEIHFTLPPGPQTVWRVVRRLRFLPGKELLPQAVVASLREKYGPEAQQPMAFTIDGMWWFTGDGKRASLPPGVGQFANCSAIGPGAMISWGSTNPGLVRYDLIQPLQALNPQQEPCRGLVKVSANMTNGNNLVSALTVEVADLALETRSHQATVAALAAGANGRAKAVLDHAAAQKKPDL